MKTIRCFCYAVAPVLLLTAAVVASQIHPQPPIAQDYTATKDAAGNDTNAVVNLKPGYVIQCTKAVHGDGSQSTCHVVLQPKGPTQDLQALPTVQKMGAGDNNTMDFTCNGPGPSTCTVRVYFNSKAK